MESTKRLIALLTESTVWLIAIWAFYVSTANILSDWQTTDRTFVANFNEAIALFPLNTLYLFGLGGSSVFLAMIIGVTIISIAIYTARKKNLFRSRNFSSLKILLIAYIAFTCVDFARYGVAWSTQSFTAQQNSFETLKFDSTRYVYVDQIGEKYDIAVSDLDGNNKEILASFEGSGVGIPLYPSPDGSHFLTATPDDEFNAELLQVRNIDGSVIKEFKWTGGNFLDHNDKPNYDDLSALWSTTGDVLAIKGKEYDGSKRAVGAITLLNVTDLSQTIVPDFTAEMMDVGSDEQGQFLIYNDPKSVWDYYRINLDIRDSDLQISEPQKLPLGVCFSAYKDMAVIEDNVYCQTSTKLYDELEYERNPDFPNNEELLIHQKLEQAEPTDFRVLSPIISNANYWVVTHDNKYLVSYLGAASYGDKVFNEDEPIYPTIVYEIESGKQQKIEDPGSLLYSTKAMPHRFIVYAGEN